MRTMLYHKCIMALGLVACFAVLCLWTKKSDGGVRGHFVHFGSTDRQLMPQSTQLLHPIIIEQQGQNARALSLHPPLLPQFTDPKSVAQISRTITKHMSSPSTNQLYTECVQHMASKRLPALVAALSQNPAHGLAPKDLTMEHIEGLDPDFFRGKQIAFMGDSTMYFLTQKIIDMVRSGRFRLKKNAMGVWERTEHSMSDESIKIKTPDEDGTHIEWMGIRAHRTGPEKDKIVDEMFTKVQEMKPQILVANMGLHWMHLCGVTNWCARPGQGLLIKNWVNYKGWLQRVYDMAVRVNSSLLLFKTTNFMCNEKKKGEWGVASSRYHSFDNKTIEDCYQMNSPHSDSDNISNRQIYNYCKYGHTTEIGSEYLNHQIREFVTEKNENRPSNSKLTLAVFDDHDVQGCNSTEDGIHHKGNLPLRIRLLANTIESYSECASLYK